MARAPLESSTISTEQQPPITDIDAYEGDVVVADRSVNDDKDYTEELAFMEEPVTIRLEPSTEKNASNRFPVWVNGKPAEMMIRGRWYPVGWLPVGETIIIKRKYLEVIIRAKIDRIETKHDDATVDQPRNMVVRNTAPVHAFSIIEDKNPVGVAWASELIRRNF